MRIEINIKGFFKTLKYGIKASFRKIFSKLDDIENMEDIFIVEKEWGGDDVSPLGGITSVGLLLLIVTLILILCGTYLVAFIMGTAGFCLSFIFWYVLLRKFRNMAEEEENRNES